VPLDVVVPDLLLPAEAPAALRAVRMPALERWIARADRGRVDRDGRHAWVAHAHALPEPLPVAAITLAADDAPREGSWLRADPVHLRIEMHGATLHDASVLDVQGEEAAALVAELQAFFRADGLEFMAPHPSRWYVRVPPSELPQTTPLDQVLGRNVSASLPRGSGRIEWRSAITEAQMVLSTHAVNVHREQAGQPQVNSVWFWGGGATPAIAARPYSVIYADDAFTRGVARLAGTRVAELPRTFDAIDAVASGENALLVLDALSAAWDRGDEAAWKEAAAAIDAWFVHTGSALERFGEVRIVLPSAGPARVFTLKPSSRWRLFRRGKPVNADA
jgi:hypothetical protein